MMDVPSHNVQTVVYYESIKREYIIVVYYESGFRSSWFQIACFGLSEWTTLIVYKWI